VEALLLVAASVSLLIGLGGLVHWLVPGWGRPRTTPRAPAPHAGGRLASPRRGDTAPTRRSHAAPVS
jgi:hypothetical protein